MQQTYIGDIKGWINNLDTFERERSCGSPAFFRPYHFVMLGLKLAQMGASVQLPDGVSAYASRMHLWQAIGKNPPVDVHENATMGKFHPLERLDDRNKVEQSAYDLARIARTYGADRKTESSLSTSLQEIMDNCFAHSGIENGLVGLACAQSWPRGQKAQIAIGDFGIGVPASLRASPDLLPRMHGQNSCEFASQLGVTSKPAKGHKGYGLALTKELLMNNGGAFLLVSDNEWFSTSGRHASRGELSTPWRGTLVVLEWNTHVPLSAEDVYRSWPLPEGYDHDDFDF